MKGEKAKKDEHRKSGTGKRAMIILVSVLIAMMMGMSAMLSFISKQAANDQTNLEYLPYMMADCENNRDAKGLVNLSVEKIEGNPEYNNRVAYYNAAFNATESVDPGRSISIVSVNVVAKSDINETAKNKVAHMTSHLKTAHGIVVSDYAELYVEKRTISDGVPSASFFVHGIYLEIDGFWYSMWSD